MDRTTAFISVSAPTSQVSSFVGLISAPSTLQKERGVTDDLQPQFKFPPARLPRNAATESFTFSIPAPCAFSASTQDHSNVLSSGTVYKDGNELVRRAIVGIEVRQMIASAETWLTACPVRTQVLKAVWEGEGQGVRRQLDVSR